MGGALVTALGFTNTTPLLQVDTVPAILISEDLISQNICTPLVSSSLTRILIDCRIVFCRCGVWPSPFILIYPDVFIRRCGLCWVLLLTWLFWDSLAESLKNTQDFPETQVYTRLPWNTRIHKTPLKHKNTQDYPETQEHTKLSWNTRIHRPHMKHKNTQDSPETQEHTRPPRDRHTITIMTITLDSIVKSSKLPLWWRLKSVLLWNKVAGQECYCSFHKESTPCHQV